MEKTKYPYICAHMPRFSTEHTQVVLQTLTSNAGAFHWLASDMNYELMVSGQADDSPRAITKQLKRLQSKTRCSYTS